MPRPRAPWWMYVVAAPLVGNFALNIYVYFWGPEPPFNLSNFKREALVVEEVLPNSAADRAALHVGDRVLSIDGRRLRSLADWDMIRINFDVGQAYRFQIERGGKQFERVVTLQRRSRSLQRQYDRIVFVLGTLSTLLGLLIAFLVAFVRPRDWVARIGALTIALSSALLGASSGLSGVSAICRRLPTLAGAFIWWPAIGFFVFPALFFTFCSIFPRTLFRSRWAWVAALTPAFLMFPIPIITFSYFTFVNPPVKTSFPDWLPRLGGSLILAYILAGLTALVLNYRRLESVNEKRRIRVLVTGSLVGLLVLAPYWVSYAMRSSPQSGIGHILYSWQALLLVTVIHQSFPISWAYAILRHRLFDIRVLIRQGVQYTLARGVLLSLVPALAASLLLDLIVHGEQPLVEILRARGWVYGVLGGLALLAHARRLQWREALDRRFFRERYDAQHLLRGIAEEVREARSFERVAPRVVARIEAALHPEFVALFVLEPRGASYRCVAAAPSAQAPLPWPTESKLMALVRVLGKPLQISLTESGWLKQQLPHEETDFLRQARVELLVPIAVVPERTEALLTLGFKRSEEPYTHEDQDLLVAIAASLALLLDRPVTPPVRISEAFEECPQCGVCYDTGSGRCAQEGASLVPMGWSRILAGRYRLEKRRGRGGMGTVYEATDTALDRRVAAKVIRDDLVGSAEAAERFRREARAAASFTHPNVVTVHDFGVAADTRAFLVMELLEGTTLREELLQQKRLVASRTIEILRGVCAGVDAAHRRQLIHRDLKPENIFLVRGEGLEIPKVLDFGIAKFLPAATQETVDTGTGSLVGTVRYMGPEQLRGQPVDAAWDLWALAVVAYETLTGEQPFNGTTPAECHSAVLAGRFTPLAQHLPESPAPWREFFARAFALDHAQRPGSAQAFFSELERALVQRQ